MSSKNQSLQEPFLNTLRKEQIPVSIFLVNGIKLQGTVDSFDQFVIVLKSSVYQMVYKHAISTIMPSGPIQLFEPEKENLKEEESPEGERTRTHCQQEEIQDRGTL